MSGGTTVNGGSGHTHTGPGDINHTVYNTYAAGAEEYAPPPDPRVVAEDELIDLRRQFVEPGRFEHARDTLREHSLLLLDGPAGCGRPTAARMLLHELHADGGRFFEVPPERAQRGPNRAEGLRTVDLGRRDRILIDLSTADAGVRSAALPQLSEFRSAVRAHGGHLVVVVPAPGRDGGEPHELER